MARYIDADKLIAEYDRVHIGAPGGARKLMVDAPTADVAPKSEVAREIFEEIERVLHRQYHDNKITLEDSGLLIVTKHSAHHSIAVLLKDIAELKKKYTEGETNGNKAGTEI